MKRTAIIAFGLALMSIRLSSASAIQHSRSMTEESVFRARQVLQEGINAMGGIDALRDLKNVTREMDGVRCDEGQGLRPIEHRSDYFHSASAPITNHPRMKSVRDMRGQRAFDHASAVLVGGQPREVRTVADAKSSFTANYAARTLQVRSPAAIAPVRTGMFRRYPEALLQSAWSRPGALRWLGESEYEGRKQQVISLADSDGAQITMSFDARTKLLTKTETVADNPVLGDIAIEVIYTDYRSVGGLTLPFRYVDKVGGVVLQDLKASAITVNTDLPEGLFDPPADFSPIGAPQASPLKKLADDVYLIPGSYNTVFVAFKDYVLVIEAGQSVDSSRSAIAQLKATVPGKPIRYLVSTHFHFDHVAGVRSYIAEGTTIITTPDSRRVIEEAAGREHILQPDALSLSPRRPVIETVVKKRVFEDGIHTVELYEIGPNPHCAEMIIGYLPREKILFEADMLDIPEAGLGSAAQDTEHLDRAIKALGLAVEQIIPVHGRPGTLEDLKSALARRGARN